MVIHCGALASPWGPSERFDAINVGGTENVVAACRAEGAALVHVSTPSLFVTGRDRIGLDTNAAWADPPPNAYARTKGEAERIVQRSVGDGLRAAIIRPRALIGSGDTVLLPRLLRAARAGVVPLIGGGRALVDATVVDNASDALLLAGDALLGGRIASGSTYNLSDGDPRTVRELLVLIGNALGVPVRTRSVPYGVAWGVAGVLEIVARMRRGPEPLLTRYGVAAMGRSLTLDSTRARQELGWTPRIGIDHAIPEAVAQHVANETAP